MSKSTHTSQSDTSVETNREHIGHSRFWNALCRDVFGPSQGGAKVMFDAEDAALGVGKTSAAVAFARHLAKAFDYELVEEDLTLSAGEYIERFREHPGPDQPSVLLLDEAVGGGAGDKRRAMSQQNVDLASAWQTMRAKRVVTLATTAHFGELDPRLKRLTDYRAHCSKRPIGQYRPYEITVGFSDGNVRMKTLDSAIHFPDMGDDPLYQHLDEQKSELLDAESWDADQVLSEDEGGDEGADEETENTRSAKDVAEEIIESGIEEYESIHGGNKTKYINKDLIEADYDLSHREADKVKSLLEREVSRE